MFDTLIKASYPQALSRMIAICSDIMMAEDCLQDAVEQALKIWPTDQPVNAIGWLVSVARNKFIDRYRHNSRLTNIASEAPHTITPDLSEQALLQSYNDDLLRLIFTCSHPALNLDTQIALTLKHVLGLSVEQLANALLQSSKTMEQRLTRAKKKIASANIEYQIPVPKQWSDRLNAVLKTIYLLFNEGYMTTEGQNLCAVDLCQEAIRLCRLLHSCIRDEPEIIGLLALMLHQHARAAARTDQHGAVILLAQQDRRLWQAQAIKEANVLVEKALRLGRGSPYAIQAAIASLYNDANDEAATDWKQIKGLYQVLMKLDPNPVIKLNAAVVTSKLEGLEVAIREVLLLTPQLKTYRHFYSCLGGLFFEQKNFQEALKYYQQCLDLTTVEAQRRFIIQRIESCTLFNQT